MLFLIFIWGTVDSEDSLVGVCHSDCSLCACSLGCTPESWEKERSCNKQQVKTERAVPLTTSLRHEKDQETLL